MSTADQIEQRVATEWRVASRKLEGYAARYGVEAHVGNFVEKIAPGAFDASIASSRDVLALVDHDPKALLARTRSGSLRFASDSDGLGFTIELPDTALAHDVLALAERGDLGGMSFGFLVPEGGEQWRGNVRELRTVDLHEISVVHSWPAYEGTSIAARARMSTSARLRLARLYLETV